jgi:hypothetical protein
MLGYLGLLQDLGGPLATGQLAEEVASGLREAGAAALRAGNKRHQVEQERPCSQDDAKPPMATALRSTYSLGLFRQS